MFSCIGLLPLCLSVRPSDYLKVWSTVKICRTWVPHSAIVPVGKPRPYSLIILNMQFIPYTALRTSSQIIASPYILASSMS